MRLAALVLLVPAAAAGAPKRFPVPATPSLRAMSRTAAAHAEPLAPRCFGYAPERRAFACLGHGEIYNTNNIGAADQATNVRVDAIGPGAQEIWTIAAIGGRPTIARAAVEKRLAVLGMRPLNGKPVPLAIGAWTTVGTAQLKLRVDGHDGDASFENFGELTIRCGARDVIADLREAGMTLGETALAYVAPDGLIAVSIVGVDGGEDTSLYTIDTAVIDVVTSCQQAKIAMWTTASVNVGE
jgi:hypothetical protein